MADFKFENLSDSVLNIPSSNLDLKPENLLFRQLIREKSRSRVVIDAYDHWIQNILPKQIAAREIVLRNGAVIRFGITLPEEDKADENILVSTSNFNGKPIKVYLHKPTREFGGNRENVTPKIARLRNYSYMASIHVNAGYFPNINSNAPSSYIRKNIGSIPVMLGSILCHTHGKDMNELIDMGEDPSDPFGYFIINGGEKVIIIQDKLRMSKILTFYEKKQIESRITNVTLTGTSIVKLSLGKKWSNIKVTLQHMKVVGKKKKSLPLFVIFDLLGFNEDEGVQKILQYVKPENRGQLQFSLSSSILKSRSIVDKISYVAAKRSLGNKNQADLYTKIVNDISRDLFSNVDPELMTVREQEIVNNLIAEKGYKELPLKIVHTLFLKHREKEGKRKPYEWKVDHLAMMAARLMETVLKMRKVDDRDSWSNKRLESPGRSLETLFNGVWNYVINSIENDIEKKGNGKVNSIETALLNFTSEKMKSNFITTFRPKSWGAGVKQSKENITDALKRETPLSTISQIRKINTPISTKSKQKSLRMLQFTQQGLICIAETPEGKTCGLVKNLASTAHISLERDPSNFLAIIKHEPYTKFFSKQSSEDHTHTLIMNGIIYGWVNPEVSEIFKIYRETNEFLPRDSLIFVNDNDRILYISTEGARGTRPLLKVVNENRHIEVNPKDIGRLVIDVKNLWGRPIEDLVKEGALVYLDMMEQETAMIAMSVDKVRERYERIHELEDPERKLSDEENEELRILRGRVPYTHSEIDPVAIFGISGGMIPKPECSQGPRDTYQASMAKQSLNAYHLNEHVRFDPQYKVLLRPQRPTFEVEMAQPICLNTMPAGRELIVAIMALPGNEEDAIIANEELFKNFAKIKRYKSYSSSEIRKRNLSETFYRPEPRQGDKEDRYSAVDKNGLPIVGKYISSGMCIYGKIRINMETGVKENISLYAGIGDGGYVDRVHITTVDTQKTLYVKLRQTRMQRAGDKFASRYAQKGTIGIVKRARDLPRIVGGINDGVVPDFFINPKSFPSRMTAGQQMEILSSKAAIYRGLKVDATAFHKFDANYWKNILREEGLNEGAYENMVRPNGRPIMNPIFVGPIYYQSLRHHVLDKFQARARGKIDPRTHQPVQGRQRGGGIRFGEMERDALVSHGSSMILLERMMYSSDSYRTIFCRDCGNIAIGGHSTRGASCKVCGVDKARFGIPEFPYIFKLTIHMLAALGIGARVSTVEES